MNVFELFLEATIFGKIIFIILCFYIVIVLGIVIQKYLLIKFINIRTRHFMKDVWDENLSIEDMLSIAPKYFPSCVAHIFIVGINSMRKYRGHHKNFVDSILSSMNSELTNCCGRAEDKLYILSLISSTAPFIGLLGTVWGIIISFSVLGEADTAGTTHFQTVFSGMSEALIATMFGLLAAIPAAMSFYKIDNDIRCLENQLHDFIQKFKNRYIDI